MKSLYRGAFSIVRRCVHKESKIEYAAKIINTRKLSTRGWYCSTALLSEPLLFVLLEVARGSLELSFPKPCSMARIAWQHGHRTTSRVFDVQNFNLEIIDCLAASVFRQLNFC